MDKIILMLMLQLMMQLIMFIITIVVISPSPGSEIIKQEEYKLDEK